MMESPNNSYMPQAAQEMMERLRRKVADADFAIWAKNGLVAGKAVHLPPHPTATNNPGPATGCCLPAKEETSAPPPRFYVKRHEMTNPLLPGHVRVWEIHEAAGSNVLGECHGVVHDGAVATYLCKLLNRLRKEGDPEEVRRNRAESYKQGLEDGLVRGVRLAVAEIGRAARQEASDNQKELATEAEEYSRNCLERADEVGEKIDKALDAALNDLDKEEG